MIKKLITKKSLYFLALIVITLMVVVVVPTYAKFSSEYETSNDVVGMTLDFTLSITNIDEYMEVVAKADGYTVFDVNIENGSNNTLYYGIWYRINGSHSGIQIGSDEDSLSSTTDSILVGTAETTSIVIYNESNEDVIVEIGVSSSSTSTSDIEYLNGKRLITGVMDINYMETLFTSGSDTSYFKSATYGGGSSIITADFIDYIDLTYANESWDVSEDGDGSIIAWVEEGRSQDDDGYYHLFIGSEEKIYARNLSNFFSGLGALYTINFENLDTGLTTDMSYMFAGCYSLSSLDLQDFDTSNVTNMSSMFSNSGLTSLDLSSFDTSNVTDMSYMFGDCTSLTSLDLGSFDTSNVTNMSSMFYVCYNLTSLDLSDFDTSSVTDMSSMFEECNELTQLNLSGFDTSNVTNMRMMFAFCCNLLSLDLSSFDTSNVTDMSSMFYECVSFSELDLSSFDTSNVTDMSYMFYDMEELVSLDIDNFNTQNVTNMSSMFSACYSLEFVMFSNIDTTSLTDISYMFGNCESLYFIKFDNGSNVERDCSFAGVGSYEGAFDGVATDVEIRVRDSSVVTWFTTRFPDLSNVTTG